MTLDDCARKYGFRYGLRLEAQHMPDAPALGSLLHLALMHRHLAQMGLDALDPVEAMRQAPGRIAHQFSRAVEVWQRYVPWADTEDAALQVLDVEREFEACINGRLVTARLDLVAARASEVIAIDHKSTGGDLRMEIRSQASKGQMALEESIGSSVLPEMYGLPFGGVWINAIGTSGAEPVAMRGRIKVPEPWRQSVIEALGGLLERAEGLESREDWGSEDGVYRLDVSPEACQGRFRDGRCDYYDLCRDGPDSMRSSFFNFDRGVDQVSLLREAAGR